MPSSLSISGENEMNLLFLLLLCVYKLSPPFPSAPSDLQTMDALFLPPSKHKEKVENGDRGEKGGERGLGQSPVEKKLSR